MVRRIPLHHPYVLGLPIGPVYSNNIKHGELRGLCFNNPERLAFVLAKTSREIVFVIVEVMIRNDALGDLSQLHAENVTAMNKIWSVPFIARLASNGRMRIWTGVPAVAGQLDRGQSDIN